MDWGGREEGGRKGGGREGGREEGGREEEREGGKEREGNGLISFFQVQLLYSPPLLVWSFQSQQIQ